MAMIAVVTRSEVEHCARFCLDWRLLLLLLHRINPLKKASESLPFRRSLPNVKRPTSHSVVMS